MVDKQVKNRIRKEVFARFLAEGDVQDLKLKNYCKKHKAQIDWLEGRRTSIDVEDFADIQRLFGIRLHQNNEGETVMHKFDSDKYEQVAEVVRQHFWKLIFDNIKHIERDANFRNSLITSLGSLQSIGEDAYFNGSQVTDLGNLQNIGEVAYFSGSQITDLGNLQNIGRSAFFAGSQITSLGNLQSIGENAYFAYSQISDLGNLQSIKGDADFRDSSITSLGNLQSIGGDACFSGSQITNLGNLQSIGGNAYFGVEPTLSQEVIEEIKSITALDLKKKK